MTDFERESKRFEPKADLSRARQRRLKHDRKLGIAPQTAAEPKRRSSRRRPSSSNGPTLKERLAAGHITVPTPSMQSIQGKLSSRLGRIARQISEVQIPRTTNTQVGTSTLRGLPRKSNMKRGESRFEATSRSETQRKSNSDRLALPRKNRRLYDAHADIAPPVMVRGGMGGMAFGRTATSRIHKQKTPKRRYDVPLKVPGAEVRLPSIPIFHLGWRFISLLMVMMMFASLILIWKAPVFQVKTVEAEGLKRLTVGDLNAVMGTFGSSVFTVDPNLLEGTLAQAFPELADVAIKVNLPANIKVVVTERVPVIAWMQDGAEVWLDDEGISFPPRGNPEVALVRVEGHGTPPGVITSSQTSTMQSLTPGMPQTLATPLPTLKLAQNLVTSILALGAKMPADTMIVYDSEHGLGWNDPNGWEVYFGAQDQDMEMKLSVYQSLVNRLQDEGIQPALISVEYVHAPYYRMER